jgi:hypothetical protein
MRVVITYTDGVDESIDLDGPTVDDLASAFSMAASAQRELGEDYEVANLRIEQ